MSDAATASPSRPPGARIPRLVIVLNLCLTAVAIAIVAGAGGLPHRADTPAWVVAPLVVVLVVAGSLRIAYRYKSELEDLDVFEAMLAPTLLLFDLRQAVAIAVVAKVASEIVARRQPIKAWFNVAQWAVATGCGALVFGLVHGSREADARALLALGAALVTVAMLNHAALIAVLSLVTQRSPRRVLREMRPAIVSGWLVAGSFNFAFGLLVSAAALATVLVVPLFVIPLAVLHLASRHLDQERASRALRLALEEATTVLTRPLDPRDGVDPFLHVVCGAFSAAATRLVLFTGGGCDVHDVVPARTPPYMRRQVGQLAQDVLTSTRATVVHPRDESFAALLEPEWGESIVAPLVADEHPIGVLCVAGAQGFTRSDGQLAVLEALCAAAAHSLARAEMVDELVTVHRRSELMLARQSQALESIASGDSLALSLGRVAAFVEAAVPGGGCVIVVSERHDDDDAAVDRADDLVVPLHKLIPEDIIVGNGPRPPASLLAELRSCGLREGEVVVPDVHVDARWRNHTDEWGGFHSCWLLSFDADMPAGVVATIIVAVPETATESDDGHELALNVARRLARMAAEQSIVRADLLYQTRHDRLTGLGNRTAFLEATSQASARASRNGRPYAVVFIDLDNFKHVNDTLGHSTGDQLLIAVGRRLHGVVRSSDFVSRHGGDEFTVLCEDLASRADAHELAGRIASALRDPFDVGGPEVTVTASIGVAVADDHATPTQLIERADAAMYHAKQSGRNKVEIFDDRTRHFSLFGLAEQMELRRALDAGEFVVHYQPVRSLATLTATGVEALVRKRETDGSLLAPGRFIALAEETGLIVPLGSFVLDQACHQVQQWRASPAHSSLGVSVNVSARQVSHGDLVETVKRALVDSKLPPHALTLEITESTLMELNESGPALHELRDLGVVIAIDDFGTGYSSLNYLRGLPVDVIKLDRVFLEELETDRASQAIVSSTVNLAEALGLCLVAEGIETQEQLRVLREFGCPEGQGYHLGRPTDAHLVDLAPPVGVRAA
jgi:diguanylate cyclase (GGDEF)-like protein